jgi:hypothetical protein
MNSAQITPSSSAAIIAFPASGKLPFAKHSKAWLATTLADQSLTPASKVFCTAIYLHFNNKDVYQHTRELAAWPKLETLMIETGLSWETLNQSIKQVERAGFLDVQRGREGQRRTVNKYYARWPQGQNSGPSDRPQGQNSEGQNFREDSVRDSPSLLRGRDIDSPSPLYADSVNSDSVNRTPERALRPEEAKEAKAAKKYNATPELVAAVARWRRVATNGSGQ